MGEDRKFDVLTEPLAAEVIKLGLGDTPFLIPDQQVQIKYGVDNSGDGKISIYVQDIEVTSIDPITQQVKYKVIGFRQYVQGWDLGGAYLDPREFAEVVDG